MQESEIIARWSQPNHTRIRGLVNLDRMSPAQAQRYDAMERRESCLLELSETRALDEAERRELHDLDRQLRQLQDEARVGRQPQKAAA